MRIANPSHDLFAIARPFLWLAAVAFVLGFAGYLALSRPDAPAARAAVQPVSAAASPSDAWNPPKPV